MKKSLLIVPLLLTLATTNVSAFPSKSELIDPDYEYEIDTWGSNSEVYEFTPKSNKSMSCVMLMLDNGIAMGLQCFPKELKKYQQ